MSEQIPAFLIAYSDSSFTNPHEVARPDEPEECTGNFTHMGAKYWGFETTRHKATSVDETHDQFRYNHDACHWFHLGLHNEATVDRLKVSTKWFTGNQVPEISVTLIDGDNSQEVLARTPLAPDQDHEFSIAPTRARQCLVRCFAEGGIARFNLFGSASEDTREPVNLLEQASVSHVSNAHYGRPEDAVAGNRGIDYMFGWESARSGFGEYCLFSLAQPSLITDVIVDTYLHRLNPPLSCHVFGLYETNPEMIEQHWQRRPRWVLTFDDGLSVTPDNFQDYMQNHRYLHEATSNPRGFSIALQNEHSSLWRPLVPFGRLRADTWHHFDQIQYTGACTHILYSHYPNGGIHGLKVHGQSAD